MSRRVKNNINLLKVLSTSQPALTKAILKEADDQLIHSICECVYNILQTTIPLTHKQKEKVLKHDSHLLKLVDKDLPLDRKRKIIVQPGGGFLSLLLPPILRVLEQLVL